MAELNALHEAEAEKTAEFVASVKDLNEPLKKLKELVKARHILYICLSSINIVAYIIYLSE